MKSLHSGYAAAVMPVQATAVTTDASGLVASEVRVPTRDGELPAYRAQPADRSGLPTVLVVQEIFGVHEHIKDVCRRLAHLGYLAIAPELYVRQGDVSTMEIPDIIAKVVSKVSDAQVMADLDAAAGWAAENGGGGPLGITGFCWGGRIVWMYAAHSRRLVAGVAWYGPLASGRYPVGVLDVVEHIQAPVLGLYGGADSGIPNETVDAMRAALKAGGNTRSEIVLYPDTPHGFHADYRESYRQGPAEDGWRRLTEWFKQYLR